jgi:hypothetical protein
MSTMMIDGVEVTAERLPDITEDEARAYVDYAREHVEGKLRTIAVAPDKEPDMVTLSYAADNVRFERIRRITGYLVGTIDRWNNAKQAEEHDRVKHIGRQK